MSETTDQRIGKIRSVRFGLVGYQDAQFGLSLDLGSDKESWGVGATVAHAWAREPDEHCKWTREDQTGAFGETCRETIALLKGAKVDDVTKLKGVPVVVVFEGSVLKSWRILEEAL